MGYKLLKQIIALGRRSPAELREMANVYHSARKLTDEEYEEIINMIDSM